MGGYCRDLTETRMRAVGMDVKKSDFERLNILVVDDNLHMRRLVRTMLHAFGIPNVQESSSAEEAIEKLRHFNAHVIITDWKMEPMDGIMLSDTLRSGENSPNPFVPIIMMSSYIDIETVEKARDAGVDEIIAKPLSAQILYNRLAAVITNPRLFVRSEGYFGPDRRRQKRGIQSERRENESDLIARDPRA